MPTIKNNESEKFIYSHNSVLVDADGNEIHIAFTFGDMYAVYESHVMMAVCSKVSHVREYLNKWLTDNDAYYDTDMHTHGVFQMFSRARGMGKHIILMKDL